MNPAPGYSTGEVQQAIEEVAAQMLPTGYGYEYGGMAREEANTGGSQTLFIYAVCILLIYLILACLYESFLVPWAVILSVTVGSGSGCEHKRKHTEDHRKYGHQNRT